MDKDQTSDLIDLGTASVETQGGNSGIPEDLAHGRSMGVDAE